MNPQTTPPSPPDLTPEQALEQQQKQFHAHTEIQALPSADRDTLFGLLRQAQAGDAAALQAVMSFAYEERPVPIDEFVLGRRYLNLRGLVNPEKLELIARIDHPSVRKVYLMCGTGAGKASHVDTPIPTPTGWTRMGDIREGDAVYDERGRACRVTAVGPITDLPSSCVEFDDHSTLVVADTHEWAVLDQATRKRLRRPDKHRYKVPQRHHPIPDWRTRWADTRIVETRDMQETRRTGQPCWAIPTTQALEGGAATLHVPPYTLGVWLGDGTTSDTGLTLATRDEDAILGGIRAEGVEARERPSVRKRKINCAGYGLVGMRSRFRAHGLLGHKHIPAVYLRAPVSDRLALLRGLIDTDGFSLKGKGGVGIDLTDKDLFEGVVELVHSLGWKTWTGERRAKCNGHDYGLCYRLAFRPDVPVTSVPFKQATPCGQAGRHTARWVRSVTSIGSQPVKCIQVDSPSHLYLAGRAMVPTHNSFIVSILNVRTIYNLLCLRRPELFYMLAPGSKIACVNMSVSKDQAKEVLYAEVQGRLEHAPWFKNRYRAFKYHASFQKKLAIFCQSKNPTVSYGYNTFFAALDECNFMLDNQNTSVAEDLTEAVTKSMNSRFPGTFKYIAISTLRDDTDFLSAEIKRIKDNGGSRLSL